MKKNIFILTLLLMSGINAGAQNTGDSSNLWPIDTIQGQYANVAVDNLDNIYLISAEQNQLKKLNSKGDSVQVFNDVKRYGNIFSIDVSNPLSIVVYYKDFATAVILDRFLNKLQTVDLRKAGILQSSAVAYSYDNNLWVFDQQDYRLKKVSLDGKVLTAFDDLRMVFDDAPVPNRIIDNDGQLYLYDPQKGWYVFDYYGAFKTKMDWPDWQDVTMIQQFLLGHDQNNLFIGDVKTYNLEKIPFHSRQTEQHPRQIFFTRYKVYIIADNGLVIYKLNH